MLTLNEMADLNDIDVETTVEQTPALYCRTTLKIEDVNTEIYNNIGLRCGSREEADTWIGAFLYRVKPLGGKVLEFEEDATSYFGERTFLQILVRNGIVTEEEAANIKASLNKYIYNEDRYRKFAKVYRDFLLSKGYVGFICPDEVRNLGKLYFVLSANGIESLELLMDTIVDLCEAETGIAWRIVSYTHNNVTLQPLGTKESYTFKSAELQSAIYDDSTGCYVFDYAAFN